MKNNKMIENFDHSLIRQVIFKRKLKSFRILQPVRERVAN